MAVERLCRQYGVELKVRMELGSNEAIKQAICGGLGISVLSRHTLSLDERTGHLVALNVEHFPIQRYWYVAFATHKQLSVVAKTFLQYLHGAAKRLHGVEATTTPAGAAKVPGTPRAVSDPRLGAR